jgi:hypothetical protein
MTKEPALLLYPRTPERPAVEVMQLSQVQVVKLSELCLDLLFLPFPSLPLPFLSSLLPSFFFFFSPPLLSFFFFFFSTGV